MKDIFTLHYYLEAFMSPVNVRFENFDYSGELLLVG